MLPTPSHHCTAISKDTLVSVEVVTARPETTLRAAMQRAVNRLGVVERTCSRFDPDSKIRTTHDLQKVTP